jgi:sporulation protein YlmC with PRC-barrel domain
VLASELLGARVLDADGTDLGRVDDIRVVQDGPLVDGFGAALRVSDLVVGPGGIAVRLGYVRHGVRGPALVRWWATRSERRCLLVPWAHVVSVDERVVRLDRVRTEVPSLIDALPDRT